MKFAKGDSVEVKSVDPDGGFTDRQKRIRPRFLNCIGRITDHSDSHGECYEVVFYGRVRAWYNADELVRWWLERIEILEVGEACEVQCNATAEWLPGIVVRNGGSGYWLVKVGEEEWTRYIEQVRCVGQTDAWPR